MIEKLYINKSDVIGIIIGFKDLNKKINGF